MFNQLLLWEYFGGLVDVELGQIIGIEQWPSILVRSCEHHRQEATGARASDDVKIVCDPSIRPVQFLHGDRAGNTVPVFLSKHKTSISYRSQGK